MVPPFYLQNAVVKNNVFEGTARFGVAFLDWIYTGPGSGELDNDLVNQGNRNVFYGNDMSRLRASDAALVFWDETHDDCFSGGTGVGAVIDNGRGTRINPDGGCRRDRHRRDRDRR